MKGWHIVTAAAILAVGAIVAACIVRQPRYKSINRKGWGSVVLDVRTGLVYPNGTGGKPLTIDPPF